MLPFQQLNTKDKTHMLNAYGTHRVKYFKYSLLNCDDFGLNKYYGYIVFISRQDLAPAHTDKIIKRTMI